MTASRGVVGFGAVVAVLAAAADSIGASSEPGWGALQWAGVLAGLAAIAWGLGDGRPRWRRAVSRILLIAGSTYAALWAIELVMTFGLDTRAGYRPPAWSLQGLYEPGERVAFRHAPGFSGRFDDGFVQVPITINSHGDRDDEPAQPTRGVHRVLLLGDSFAFGYGLPDAERIDRRAEQHAEGKLDAYNLGVQSYGAGHSHLRLLESDWWTGDRVYYLFFNNDLQTDNCTLDKYTVFDGFVVPQLDDRGESYAPAQWRSLIDIAREHGSVYGPPNRLRDSVALPKLRGLVRRALDADLRRNGFPTEAYPPANVTHAVEHVLAMRDEARRRGAAFSTVVQPALGEVVAGEYSAQTAAFVAALRAEGVEVLEVLDELGPEHYFRHDPHFNAEGADVVGRVLAAHALKVRT